MKKKIVLLFLALLLPGLIFVFLKKFGKNEFAIPVYFENNVDSLNQACGTHYLQPYRIADSILENLVWQRKGATLLTIDAGPRDLNRITDRFGPGELQIIGLPEKSNWRSCVFMIKPSSNAVLMDGERRIRGYYSTHSRKEIDRLGLELEILLKKY